MKTLRNHLLIPVLLMISAGLAAGQGKKTPAASSSAAPAAAPAPSSSAAIEAQMLAFGAVDHIAAAIASEVCSRIPEPKAAMAAAPGIQAIAAVVPRTVVIYDQASFASLQSYEAFIENSKSIVSLYETLLSDDKRKALDKRLKDAAERQHPGLQQRALGLSGAIDPFGDATSLLSAIAVSSNAEAPGSIVIPDSAMAVAVTRELSKACPARLSQVVYPPLFGKSSATDYSAADIQTDLQILHDVRAIAIRAVNDDNSQWMKDRGAAAGNPILTAALTDVNGMYDGFMNSLLQVNAAGAMGSASVIQGFQLASVLAGPAEQNGTYKHPAFILLASVLSAGGTELDHKTFWTNLGNGDKITYSGGVIVNVALWHADDKAPVYSDLLRYRVPFSDVLNPANTDNVRNGDNLPAK